MKTRSLGALVALTFLLGACASGTIMFTPSKLNRVQEGRDGIERIEFPGPDPMISRERIEPINLLVMLDPANAAARLYAQSQGQPPTGRAWKDLTIDEKYEWGFHAFYDQANNVGDNKSRRNRVQDRLIITSDQRCGIYKRLINQIASDNSYWTGSIATVSGVLGSLLGGNAARNLAAVSGISSGMGAEFSQAYYSNLAANVITKGVEERRKAIFTRIAAAQKADLETYTVQAAIKDAVFYDMQCSIIAGLEEAQDAIRLAANPGIDAANRIIARQKITAELIHGDVAKVKELSATYAELESSSLLGGDRFSNVGVTAATNGGALPVPPPSYYTGHATEPTAAEKALREALGKIYQPDPKLELGKLELEDGAAPPKPTGGLKDFNDLNQAFKTTYDACWPGLYHGYLDLLASVEKAGTQAERDKAVIDARAALQKMEAIKQLLIVRKNQIDALRNSYLRLAPEVLFDGSLDGSRKDGQGKPLPVKLRSLTQIDGLGGKTQFDLRAQQIKAGLTGLCP